MAKKKSKSDIIRAYVSKYPNSTWITARETLERKGIKPSYFASERSKLKATGIIGETAGETAEGVDLNTTQAVAEGPKQRGPKGVDKRAAVGTGGSDLTAAAQFARSAGGLDKARALLEQLAQVQV